MTGKLFPNLPNFFTNKFTRTGSEQFQMCLFQLDTVGRLSTDKSISQPPVLSAKWEQSKLLGFNVSLPTFKSKYFNPRCGSWESFLDATTCPFDAIDYTTLLHKKSYIIYNYAEQKSPVQCTLKF